MATASDLCRVCNSNEPEPRRRVCRQCLAAQARERYAANRELMQRRAREYREHNRNEVRERDRERYAQEAERRRAYQRDYYQANRDKIRAHQRATRDAEDQRRRNREYYLNNREKFFAYARAREVALLGATVVKFTEQQLAQRLSMFPGCWICRDSIDILHIDHVKPISKGGLHCLSNLRPACRSCNLAKSNTWPFDPTSVRRMKKMREAADDLSIRRGQS